VYAISPYNFTALAATLVDPASLLDNVVIWKLSLSDSDWLNVPRLVDSTPLYVLTGIILARDQYASIFAQDALKHSAGMLYLNTSALALLWDSSLLVAAVIVEIMINLGPLRFCSGLPVWGL
jgi:hypothetical protein